MMGTKPYSTGIRPQEAGRGDSEYRQRVGRPSEALVPRAAEGPVGWDIRHEPAFTPSCPGGPGVYCR